VSVSVSVTVTAKKINL